MLISDHHIINGKRLAVVMAIALLAAALPGCTANPELAGAVFNDPGKYALYNCQQLETEHKTVATKEAELRGLINKAETGVAGSVVAEAAYGSDYASVRQQLQAIGEAQRQNRCPERAR